MCNFTHSLMLTDEEHADLLDAIDSLIDANRFALKDHDEGTEEFNEAQEYQQKLENLMEKVRGC